MDSQRAPNGNTTPLYTIGGSVSGLTGTVALQNSGRDNLSVSANGAFTFGASVANGDTYATTVFTQPTGQTCTVSAGSGTVSGGNVGNVAVTCSTNSYTVGGNVSGLTGTVVLQDNNGDNRTILANGAFTFATPVTYGSNYAVSVLTQPSGQTCSVSAGAGTVSGSNVTNVAVVCSTNSYTVGGNVSGLSGSVVLQDNNSDNLTVSASGAFTFATPVANGSPYSVTVLTNPTGQSCSVASSTGTISLANVSTVAVTCATSTHTIGGTVSGLSGSMVLQDNLGDNLTVSANGSFTFATAVAYGSPYSVTKLSLQYANQDCVISNGSGTVSGNVSVMVNCTKLTAPRYAYTANYFDSSVSTYVVDAPSGRLKYIGKVATGANPYSVTVDPSGKYAYVANFTDNNVSQYSIGTNGALTALTPATVSASSSPQSVTVDPSGKYAYVANGGGGVSQYSIGTNGALTSIATDIAAGSGAISVTVDPSGKYAYVANIGGGGVSQYSIGANGALTSIAAMVATGSGPISVTVDPSGKYAYVANSAANTVSQYSIGANGALTAMTPATVAAGADPYSVTVDPTGKYAYVANQGDNTVSQYSIGANGALTSIAAAVAAGSAPASVTVDPSGKYAYVANLSGKTVSQYSIDAATGALTPLSTATVADIAGPLSIVVSAGTSAVQAVPKYAYVANFTDGTVSQYNIDATTGALSAMGSPTVTTGTGPRSVTVDPSGKYAYVANNGGNVSQYSIDANGGLTAMSPATVVSGSGSISVTVDPSGKYAYVANQQSLTVSQYSIGTNGALGLIGTANCAAGVHPTSVTVDPSGKYVYVSSQDASSNGFVSQYSIGTNGVLTSIAADIAAGQAPYSVTVDPSGKYAYVATWYNVSQYSIDTATGALSAMSPATIAAGSAPFSVTVDPTGKYAYVANMNSMNVSQFSIGANGALTSIAANIVAGNNPTSVNVDPSGKYVYVANSSNSAGGNSVSQYSIGANGTLTSSGTFAAGTAPYSVTTTGTWQ